MTVLSNKLSLPTSETALPGRKDAMQLANAHFVHGRPIQPPFEGELSIIFLGLGCFWGAERKFWAIDGVYTTAVGYCSGVTPNPTYEEVCSGLTGHNEVVMVVFDSKTVSLQNLLKVFFESHDPTQGMRQGNDQGTQYRSGIYVTREEHRAVAQKALDAYQSALSLAELNLITTELLSAPDFYYAEEYHQQYLAKNPNGYCGIGGTGVTCAI